MRQRIIRETIAELWEDTKFIRLATVTMFIHSLIFTILIIRYAQYFVDAEIVEQFVWLFQETLSLWWVRLIPIIALWVILAIWYWILPPVWEAAMIIYRDEWRQQWTTSLTKWFGKFFPMFEFHAATWLFQIPVIIFAVLRMIAYWVIDSWIIIVLMIMWILVTMFVQVFFAYSKMFITIEDEWFFDAMKKSTTLAMHNIGITVQFVVLTLLLGLRFIVNIMVLVWVPLWLIYLWTRMWLDSILFLKIAFIIGMIVLIFLVAYVEWIIEAFFITCRWKVWKHIKQEEQTS